MAREQTTAHVAEVFSSIQGEGLYVGRRQVFVRFRGCNLRCAFCDTPLGRDEEGPCRFEAVPGSGELDERPNPVDAAWLLAAVRALAGTARHHSISLTGGEPLLHAEFLRRWLLTLDGGLYVHLETNGTLPDEMERLAGLVDVTAMDVKLPSVTGQAARLDDHLRFLQVAARREVFVKVVFGEQTPDAELGEVARVVGRVDATIPVVLQPLTGTGSPGPGRILAAHAFLSKSLPKVFVIAQTHKPAGLS